MSDEYQVDILLGSYNGSEHLVEQIESILNQSHQNFRLLIRDDGSSDGTPEIIHSFSDDRIILIDDSLGNIGVTDNFRVLLGYAQSPYVMFSDQDDVWFVDKVARMVGFLSEKESIDLPCLAYSPGIVVDAKLNPSTDPVQTAYRPISTLGGSLFLNGGIQGCAMILNKTLYTKLLKCEFEWYMHDQAVTLFALCFGNVFFYQNPLFYYRQHSNNVVGFKKNSTIRTIFKYLLASKHSFLIKRDVRKSVCSFYDANHHHISKKHQSSLYAYVSLNKIHMIKFVYLSYKHQWSLNGSKARLIFKALVCKRLSE